MEKNLRMLTRRKSSIRMSSNRTLCTIKILIVAARVQTTLTSLLGTLALAIAAYWRQSTGMHCVKDVRPVGKSAWCPLRTLLKTAKAAIIEERDAATIYVSFDPQKHAKQSEDVDETRKAYDQFLAGVQSQLRVAATQSYSVRIVKSKYISNALREFFSVTESIDINSCTRPSEIAT